MISVAVTVPIWNVGTTAFERVSWSIAHSTDIQSAHAGVLIITESISIEVFGTRPATLANGVELVSIAVTVAHGDGGAPAVKHSAWPIAESAGIQFADAGVHIVADPISIQILGTTASADTKGIQLVAIAVAIAFGDVVASAFIHCAGAIADPAVVQFADTRVNHVAHTVRVEVLGATSSADAQCVRRRALAVAGALWESIASANSAGIEVQAGRIEGVGIVAGGQVCTSIERFADAIRIHVRVTRAVVGLVPGRFAQPGRIERGGGPNVLSSVDHCRVHEGLEGDDAIQIFGCGELANQDRVVCIRNAVVGVRQGEPSASHERGDGEP